MKFLAANEKIISFHQKISRFTAETNSAIASKHNEQHPKPFVGGALFSIGADIFSIHEAIKSLCTEGWAFSAPILLRTQFDLIMNASIFANSDEEDDQEYMGFKYSNFFLKANLFSNHFTEQEKTGFRNFLKEKIKELPISKQEKAKKFFFQEKLYGYWFCPEFKNSKSILDSFSQQGSDWNSLYDYFSGATHGGLLGLKSFRDSPDEIHPNPRPDPKAQNQALSISSRLLLDFNLMRGIVENIDRQGDYDVLFSEFRELQELFTII